MTKNLLVLLLLCLSASAQSSGTSTIPAASSAPAVPAFDVAGAMGQIDQTSQRAALQISYLRIDKWKGDSQLKAQARSNAESLQRNMMAALPTLTASVRSNPQDTAANFKLYRNMSALVDVLNTLAQSAGAHGPKEEFAALAHFASQLDESRRSLGDYLESLTAAKEAELARLRSGSPAATTSAPKKIIVDNEPDPKPKPKKKKQ